MSGDINADTANLNQIEYWNSDFAKKWILFQNDLDNLFQSVLIRLLERAQPVAGENALDIGCGTGATSRALAEYLQPSGSVQGLDISEPLLGLAKESASHLIGRDVQYTKGDAQIHRFEQAHYDLLISRFGVMFFDDPVLAFQNMYTAMRSGGRLCFVCWGPLLENAFFDLPRKIAVQRLGAPDPLPSNAPGPFAFSDKEYVVHILQKAGFEQCFGETESADLIFPGTLNEFTNLTSHLGPADHIIRVKNGTESDVAYISMMTEQAFRKYATKEGVYVPAVLNFFEAIKP